MKKVFKVVLAMVLALSLLPGVSAWAAAPPDTGVKPNMTILESGEAAIYSGAEYGENYVEVSVTTSALTVVEKLYHIITVYRNGEMVMDHKEFAEYKTDIFNTSIRFYAEKGDIFKVVIEHGAKDGSVKESKPMTVFGDY